MLTLPARTTVSRLGLDSSCTSPPKEGAGPCTALAGIVSRDRLGDKVELEDVVEFAGYATMETSPCSRGPGGGQWSLAGRHYSKQHGHHLIMQVGRYRQCAHCMAAPTRTHRVGIGGADRQHSPVRAVEEVLAEVGHRPSHDAACHGQGVDGGKGGAGSGGSGASCW